MVKDRVLKVKLPFGRITPIAEQVPWEGPAHTKEAERSQTELDRVVEEKEIL